MQLLDYNQLTLYLMYLALIILSLIGAYFHILTNETVQYILLIIVGHFMGVLTPAPPSQKPVLHNIEEKTT